MAIATTVHFVKSWVSATRTPSRTAIQRTIRVRRSRSQRPVLVVPCSIGRVGSRDSSVAIASTVPSRHAEPGSAHAPQCPLGCGGGFSVLEEAVNGRTGATHVRPEGAELAQLVRERGRRQVVGREVREIARPADRRERLVEPGAALGVALLAATLVESCVDRRGRLLVRVLWQDEG